MVGEIEETESEFQASNKVTCQSISNQPILHIVSSCASGRLTVVALLNASHVVAEATGPTTIAVISYPEEIRQQDLTIEIQGYNVEYHATGYEEESLKSSPLTSTERMARKLLTLSGYSEGQYASAQRQRLMKWHSTTGRK